MTAWLLLALSLYGVVLTINAYRPPRLAVLSVFAFFNGWLVSEMPVQTVVGQAAVTGGLIAAGALDGPAGWAGLGVSVLSWVGLLGLVVQAGRAGGVLERALDDALPPGWRDALPEQSEHVGLHERLQLVVPFWMRDRRVEVVRNIDYCGDGRRAHRLDVYRPKPAEGRRRGEAGPVLLYIHGGAWFLGDKREQGKPMMLHLAARGWVCVTINYRLSPKATWPDHIVDCKRALGWVREHVADFGGDPGFVAVSGGSAGGHLAALVALTPNDPRYQPGFESTDTSVDACVPFYGAYDFVNREGLRNYGFGRMLERMVMKTTLADAPDLYRDASPVHRVGPDAPPFLIIHGANDTLIPVKEARTFADRLRDVAGRAVVYVELPGAQHAFEVFRSIRTGAAVRAVTEFLDYVRLARSGAAPVAAAAFSSSAMDARKSSARSQTSGIASRSAMRPTSIRSM